MRLGRVGESTMTPEERERWAQHFNYRRANELGINPSDANGLVVVLPVVVPFSLFFFGGHMVADGGPAGVLGGTAMIAAGIAVLVVAWRHFSRPKRPLDDEDFDRELRFKIAEEQNRRSSS